MHDVNLFNEAGEKVNPAINVGESSFAVNGESGVEAIAAATGTKKHRLYKLAVQSVAAGTVSFGDGIGSLQMGTASHATLDFGTVGKLQDTADTAITVTNSAAGFVSASGVYSSE